MNKEVELSGNSPSITRREVEEAINGLRNGKAAGFDNIPAEFLKTGDIVVDLLHKIWCKAWENGVWPSQWTKSIIVPLPKTGDLQDCSNYRTISLLSHPSKVLLKIILNRLKPQIEELLVEEQAGFQKVRSTVEQIFNVHILCETYRDHGHSIYHNFIDFKKAFHRVWHQALWITMRKHNIDPNILKIVESFYHNTTCGVLYDDNIGQWFRTTVGVRQGCLLSPCLFNLFLEQIMTNALENHKGTIAVGGRKITNLRFADDIDLMARTADE